MNSEEQGTPEGGSSPLPSVARSVQRRKKKTTDRADKGTENRERGKVSYVRLDIARFTYEVGKHKKDGSLAKWIRELVDCLVLRDSSKNSYGAELLVEAQTFRERDRARKKREKKK